ncbi:MAG: hypothetical protein M3Z23_08040 [Acidobacteriota bacterium]|nr:hypothetical protein [Acidobacteriota bacterium]
MDENIDNTQARGGCVCAGAGPQATAMFQSMWSQATRDHFRNSRVEFLKGVRSLIDHRIERLSRNPQQRGTTVPVD